MPPKKKRPPTKNRPGNGYVPGGAAIGGRRPAPTPKIPIGWGPNGPRYSNAPAPATPAGTAAPAPGFTSDQQSAYDVMNAMLQDVGLGELSDDLWGLVSGGTTDSASLQLSLQGTDAWKRRFAGNEMLKGKGQVLSVSEYLATEKSYAQIMRNYGLPEGFYDEPADFANWIGNGVSANELQQRVAAYSDLAGREDPSTVAQLQSMGLSKGDLLAYMIDPDRAAPLVQRQYQTALLGSAARRSGFAADNGYLDQLAARGVTEDQASQGYSAISASLADAQRLGLSAEELQSEVFENNAAAGKKRKRLASQERASFGGSSGVAGGSLSQNSQGSY